MTGSDSPNGTGDAAARWELRLVVAGQGTTSRAVALDVAADARVGDLLDALDATAIRRPDGSIPPSDLLVEEVGLRHGDVVTVLDGAPRDVRAADDGRVELNALGVQWRLGAGRHAIGRGSGCSVVLAESSVSRVHATVTVSGDPDDPTVLLTDEASTNGSFVGGVRVSGTRRVALPATVELGDTAVDLVRVDVVGDVHRPLAACPSERGWVRVPSPPCSTLPIEEVVLDAPPTPPAAPRPRFGWLPAGAPLVLALAVVVVSLATSPSGLDGSYLWLTVAFLMLSPLMVVAGHLEARRAWRADRDRLAVEFSSGLAALDAAIDAARREELRRRREAHPAPAELRRRAARVDPRLWERRPSGDAPRLRLGSAPGRSAIDVRVADHQGDRAAVAQLDARVARARELDDVPLVVAAPCAIGVVGSARATSGVASWLMLQAATTVAPSRLRIELVAGEDRADVWGWLDWLGRVPGRHGTRVTRHPAADAEEVLGPGRSDASPAPDVVHLVVADTAVVGPDLRVRRTDDRAPASITVWLAAHRTDLPAGCDVVIELAANDGDVGATGARPAARVSWPESGRSVDARIDAVGPGDAVRWARSIAPLAESGTGHADDGDVPDAVSLAELVGGGEGALDGRERAVARWSAPPPGLTVTLGADGDGPVRLDLRSDGPHMMVAGTTGSGKSELLRTLVLSAAAAYPPERLQLLLVDYKGGAAFGPCATLPHVTGMVSDLDAGLAARVLTSLRAELRRRERVLAESGHASVADAEDAAAGEGGPPPLANLIVVVDEFATVASEVPEFLDGMIDIGRRGRSLGLHLVLATQRPAGVVNDHLRANVSIRVALRVADPQDSLDVVGTPDAASLGPDRPGRALLSIGDGAVRRFHSAWCARRSPTAGDPSATRRSRRGRPRVVVRDLCVGGAVVPERPVSQVSDLDRLVGTLVGAAAGRSRPPGRLWIEPLPETIDAGALLASWRGAPGRVILGVADEPDRQAQGLYEVDLGERGALAVIGATAWVGEVLRAMAVTAVAGHSPESIRLDVIDASPGHGWAPLESLPQVGSVMAGDDHERIERLLRDLENDVRRGGDGGCRRVLVVDNLGAMVAAAEQVGARCVDALARIVADGSSVGVHVVVGCDRRSAVPAAVWGGLGVVAVGAMASTEEFESCASGARRPPAIAGRVVVDGSIEVQCVVSGPDSTAARVAAERRRFPGVAHPDVGRLPDDVPLAVAARSRMSAGSADAGLVVVGVRDDDLGPATVDLGAGNLLVAGPMGSGRSTTLRSIARAFDELGPRAPRRVLVTPRPDLDRRPGPWSEIWWGEGAADALLDLAEQLDAGPAGPWKPSGCVVFVDDATELDEDVSAALERLARLSVSCPVRLVVAAESGPARQSYGGVVARLRRERRALLLQPDRELDGDLVGVRLPHRGRRSWPPGRGELVVRGDVHLVQVAR